MACFGAAGIIQDIHTLGYFHFLYFHFMTCSWVAVGSSQAVFGLSTRWDLILDLIKMRQRSIFNHTLDCLRPAYTTSVISTYLLYTALKVGIFIKIEVGQIMVIKAVYFKVIAYN